jgi:hypothetical protein
LFQWVSAIGQSEARDHEQDREGLHLLIVGTKRGIAIPLKR